MPSKITAGDASNGLAVTSGNDQALVLEVGPPGAKVAALSISAAGVLKPLDAAWPVFISNGGSASSSGDGVQAEVTSYTKTFDTASALNTTTGRFTPQVAGYYQINASLAGNSNGVLGMSVAIFKNGTATGHVSSMRNGTAQAAVPILSVGAVVYLNGTTDYVSIFGTAQGGTTPWTLSVGAFSGALIRAA